MVVTDPIADMLTRIRNAMVAKQDIIEIPSSNMKKAIAKILLDEGFIRAFEVVNKAPQGVIRMTLKYGANRERVISGLKRISKPGLRVYVGTEEIPSVLGGLGIVILSTNQGVMTDKQAKKSGVGGEVLAYVW